MNINKYVQFHLTYFSNEKHDILKNVVLLIMHYDFYIIIYKWFWWQFLNLEFNFSIEQIQLDNWIKFRIIIVFCLYRFLLYSILTYLTYLTQDLFSFQCKVPYSHRTTFTKFEIKYIIVSYINKWFRKTKSTYKSD